MKNKLSLLSIGLAVILSAGCASYGNKLDQSKVSQIKKGVTTRAEVETLLGPPGNTTMMGDGKRMMIYSYHEVQAKGQSFIPYAGMFVGGANSRNQMLQIILTKENIVEDYELNDTKGDTTGGAFTPKTTITKTPEEKK